MPISELRERFSEKDQKMGPRSRSKIMQLYKNYAHGRDPHDTLLYGLLCLIYDGFNTVDKLKENIRLLFVSATKQLVVEDDDVEEFLHIARKAELITMNRDVILLTKKGKELAEISYLETMHTSYWMRRFFSQKMVMIATAIFLIILSSAKILTGIQISSEGMFIEGLENLTDLIKIGIISILSLKLKRDRLASLIIIGMMMFTGGTMIWSSIEALLNPAPIIPTIQAYFIGFISIALNAGLMWLKSITGRASGNLSLLSDSKDSELNIEISAGVLIGLIFAIFRYYFVDALVGLIIAILLFKEGIEIIIELVKKEEDFDITEIKVYADNMYNNRLTGYILGSVRREQITRETLIERFEKGLELGRMYYIGFADFFYDRLGPEIAQKHLDKLIESGDLALLEDHLILTPKGTRQFYLAKAKEFRARASKIQSGKSQFTRVVSCIIFLAIIVCLIVFANDINMWLMSF